MARTVGVGERVLVRLALLPGMSPEDEPSPEEIMQMKLGLHDPAMQQKMLEDAREQRDNPDLTTDQLTEQMHLYPRIRPAEIAYVDRGENGPTGFVNLDVFTPGSTVLQPAVGRIPKWATQHFRLDNVQFFVKEPEEGHDKHVAFWAPETEEEAPTRLERKK